jgi:hypothetical protein
LEHLADLYLKQPIDSYSIIAPVKLLKSALTQVEAICTEKGIKVKIRKNRTSPVKFYCNVQWMKMALTECLLKLIHQADQNSVIFIKMDLHGHFLTIIIEQSAEDISVGELDDAEWIEQKLGAGLGNRQVKDTVSFDLLMAERVISLHGGVLKMVDDYTGKRFLIELPAGYNPALEITNTDMQLKIYAEDLARLQARQTNLTES